MATAPHMTPEERVKTALALSASSGVSPEQALQMLIHAEVASTTLGPASTKRRIATACLWFFAVLGIIFFALVVAGLIVNAVNGGTS